MHFKGGNKKSSEININEKLYITWKNISRTLSDLDFIWYTT